MFKINRKVEYALMALKYLLENKKEKVSVRELSDNLAIPFDTTSQVLQSLKRSGLTLSVQGVSGGYTLSQKIETLSFLELSEIIENKKFYEDCSEKQCCHVGKCTIQSPIENLHKQLHQTFEQLKVMDLIQREISVE